MANILVIGSSNTDMVIKTPRFPQPGETLLGGTFFMNPGGKGANQAVAAARLGGNVQFICKVGRDLFGQQALRTYQKEKIDVSASIQDETHPSGIAIITVDQQGENTIVVAPGANFQLNPDELTPALEYIQHTPIVLVQLEIPLFTLEYISQHATGTLILNPAPAQPLSTSLLSRIHTITPNEHEAQHLTGIAIKDRNSAREAARLLRQKGVQQVIITLGARGAYLQTDAEEAFVSAPPVIAQDTTAAGDVFNGALAVAMAENLPIRKAVIFACKAASLSVTRMGAQDAAPFRYEVADASYNKT